MSVLTIKKDYQILEFDCTREAVIEPHKLFGCLDIPERCVITFIRDVIDRLKEASKLKIVKELRSEADMLPVYEIKYEGTSYHYLPPSRECEVSINELQSILEVLDMHKVPYIKAKTWTTDAFYRETREKVELWRSEGCVFVEMECAAFCAVAKFRDGSFGQILYGGDDLSCEEWDSRCWHERTEVRQKVFELAVESCLNL